MVLGTFDIHSLSIKVSSRFSKIDLILAFSGTQTSSQIKKSILDSIKVKSFISL